MKTLLLLALLIVVCTGCSTYQYATISSPIKKENQHEFIVENDTVKITYDFSGEQGPVKISLYNKLSTPLYVDWSKSALIIGDMRKSYSDKNLSLAAEMNGTETRWMNYASQSATINGKLTSGEVSGFIPPKSQAQETPLTLSPKLFQLPTAANEKNRKMEDGIIVEFQSYSPDETPFTFRSYLTLSANSDLSSPIHLDHAFWVSEVIQTTNGPKKFSVKPDRFYLKKTSNAGAYVLGAGVAGIVFFGLQHYGNEKASLD
ncbi:MAG: hypothetical protein U0U09_09425 [Cyclobacteriaceae bacterium]